MAALPFGSRSEPIARRDQGKEQGEDHDPEGQGSQGQGQPPLVRPASVVRWGVARLIARQVSPVGSIGKSFTAESAEIAEKKTEDSSRFPSLRSPRSPR